MYTGITQGLYPVSHVAYAQGILTYTVTLNAKLIAGLEIGNSVAIDGACQTVVDIDGHNVTFNAIDETLKRTTLSQLHIGQLVSVERSAKIGDELGGHEVAGHVYEVGKIHSRHAELNNLTMTIQVTPQCIQYIVEKGFVAVDGSSLTVGLVDRTQACFNIHLIPETLRVTNFGNKQVGDGVNIELDPKAVMIAEMVKQYLT